MQKMAPINCGPVRLQIIAIKIAIVIAYLNLMEKMVTIYMGRTGPKNFGEIAEWTQKKKKKLPTAGLITSATMRIASDGLSIASHLENL